MSQTVRSPEANWDEPIIAKICVCKWGIPPFGGHFNTDNYCNYWGIIFSNGYDGGK